MPLRILSPRERRRTFRHTAALVVFTAAISVLATPVAASTLPSRGDWIWPVAGAVVTAEYAQPAHRFGAGHRGIDLRVREIDAVRAPADGRVAYAGDVAGRPVVTIEHGGGLVTTLEPVASRHPVGRIVARGEPVGDLGAGGHAAPGTLHFGVRLDGEYINPLILLGGIPRAILLPCC